MNIGPLPGDWLDYLALFHTPWRWYSRGLLEHSQSIWIYFCKYCITLKVSIPFSFFHRGTFNFFAFYIIFKPILSFTTHCIVGYFQVISLNNLVNFCAKSDFKIDVTNLFFTLYFGIVNLCHNITNMFPISLHIRAKML